MPKETLKSIVIKVIFSISMLSFSLFLSLRSDDMIHHVFSILLSTAIICSLIALGVMLYKNKHR